ncbi:hypothetical protein DP107_06955 [Haloglomus irregulare]|jgi:hypothetical protein|uniref:Uncharacterized protein n=1 Tax=Haloglomus irregulare TaxID=2234134 RepID=A0A554NCH0_9EURY|nr:hypothetical protein [Haloglomus irregulare]TSD14710.1 hypothetical protein DP107_06955 [Haloglomus irregulare]
MVDTDKERTKIEVDTSVKETLDRIRRERAPDLDLSYRQMLARLVTEEADRIGVEHDLRTDE